MTRQTTQHATSHLNLATANKPSGTQTNPLYTPLNSGGANPHFNRDTGMLDDMRKEIAEMHQRATTGSLGLDSIIRGSSSIESIPSTVDAIERFLAGHSLGKESATKQITPDRAGASLSLKK